MDYSQFIILQKVRLLSEIYWVNFPKYQGHFLQMVVNSGEHPIVTLICSFWLIAKIACSTSYNISPQCRMPFHTVLPHDGKNWTDTIVGTYI